jgi:hypothetical protein
MYILETSPCRGTEFYHILFRCCTVLHNVNPLRSWSVDVCTISSVFMLYMLPGTHVWVTISPEYTMRVVILSSGTFTFFPRLNFNRHCPLVFQQQSTNLPFHQGDTFQVKSTLCYCREELGWEENQVGSSSLGILNTHSGGKCEGGRSRLATVLFHFIRGSSSFIQLCFYF